MYYNYKYVFALQCLTKTSHLQRLYQTVISAFSVDTGCSSKTDDDTGF